jgi:hypothetical protein
MSVSQRFCRLRALVLGLIFAVGFGLAMPQLRAQQSAPAITKQTIAELDKAMEATGEGTSEARHRLALRRVIRDAQQLVEAHKNDPGRFLVLEFLFRAHQRLIAIDDDAGHRTALLDICRELVKAPDDLAELRLEADILLNQAEIVKQGANAEDRSKALRPLVDRYVDTPAGPKVLRMAMLIALELGDTGLVNHLRELITERFAGNLEMISFQRDKLGGQVIGAPFIGTFQSSDGKTYRFPMDGLGRSTMLLFWSKEGGGEKLLKGIADASREMKGEMAGRLDIISFNLDELPDAGESIVRGHGVDWLVLRLPGGRGNPIYKAYIRHDPRILTMTPTGYTAMLMDGTTRQKQTSEGDPDYIRMMKSSLSRGWTDERYTAQIASLMAGDFLVLDPEGGIDPARPPELKALAKGQAGPLSRSADSVPEETLRAIQECFIGPPLRYRLSHPEVLANYSKAADLCRQAIAAHPAAPDLWIVRNRLMAALIGLWKTETKLAHFEAAVAEAKVALDAGYPKGCDLLARFCLARAALRDPTTKPGEMIERFIADSGGESASGPALAAAALLALDVADRMRFVKLRKAILDQHTEYPMMWIFTSFLLDRYHNYWLFKEPFQAGWSFGRRESNFLSSGDAEEARRFLKTELRAMDGKPLRIPEDLDSQWTMILFSSPPPWSKVRDDGLPTSPVSTLQSFREFAALRPAGEVNVLLATIGGDAAETHAALLAGSSAKNKVDCPVFSIPDGIGNPLVKRLGFLSEDKQLNSLLVSKDGRIALVVSGFGKQGGRGGGTLGEVICHEDELAVFAALERGDVQAAKDRIMTLAPPFDPAAVDEKGRKLKKPEYTTAHLRARARVYAALKEYDKALADAEEIYSRQYAADSGMSQRTLELDEAEQFRDEILQRSKAKAE